MLRELFDTAVEIFSAQYITKSTMGALLAQLQRKRIEVARDVWFDELRSGDEQAARIATQDDQIAILYRYLRSAHEGAARINLRIMARLLRGKAAQKPMYANDFLRYASLIEGLCAEEIVLLAATYKLMKAGNNRGNEMYIARQQLEEAGLLSGNRFHLYTQALQRTGFVTISSVGGFEISSGTELLREFGQLSELEAIDPAELV